MARKSSSVVPQEDVKHLCCCEYRGLRCQYVWVVSESTTGGAGKCNRHRDLDLKGKNEPDYAVKYAKIVHESHDWAQARNAARAEIQQARDSHEV